MMKKFMVFSVAVLMLLSGVSFSANKVVEWSFEDDVNDTSGNGNNGTVVLETASDGVVYSTDSISGKSIVLDNQESVERLSAVNLPTGLDQPWSINVYVKPSAAVNAWDVIAGFGSNDGNFATRYITADYENGEYIGFYASGSNLYPKTAKFSVNNWQMITATYDGTDLIMYLNGIPFDSVTASYAACDPDVGVGRSFWSKAVGWFNGSVDEFTVWDDALTDIEIDVLAASLPIIPGKVLEWKGESAAVTTPDTSGKANNGTLIGNVTIGQGLVGNCFVFPGDVESYVANPACIDLPVDPNSGWTINCYVYFNAAPESWATVGGFGSFAWTEDGTTRGLISTDDALGDHAMTFAGQNGQITPPHGSATDFWDVGRWQMATVSFDGNKLTLYKNGTQIATNETQYFATPFLQTPDQAAIGYSGWGQKFDGKIDEFCIWNYALSQSEIADLISVLPSDTTPAVKVLEWKGEGQVDLSGESITVEQAIPTASITPSVSDAYDTLVLGANQLLDVFGISERLINTDNSWEGAWVTTNGATAASPVSAVPGQTASGAAWLKFDFDGAYNLGDMMVWNANQADGTSQCVKNITVEYHDGSSWQVLGDYVLTQSAGGIDEAADIINFGGVNASSVVITISADDLDGDGISDGHYGNLWGANRYGLDEVRFGIDGTTLVIGSPEYGVADTSGNGNDGKFGNPATSQNISIVPGIVGNAMRFPGDGSYVLNTACSNLPTNPTDSWSINMYAYFDAKPQNWATMGGFGTFVWSSTNDTRALIGFDTLDGSLSGLKFAGQSQQMTPWGGEISAYWDVAQWQMATVTYDGKTVKLYKNGGLIASRESVDFAVPFVNTWQRAALGYSDWGQQFTGKIDEFTIWDGALTQQEIADMVALVPAQKVVDWTFDNVQPVNTEEFIDGAGITVFVSDEFTDSGATNLGTKTIDGSGMTGLKHDNGETTMWLAAELDGSAPTPSSAMPGIIQDGAAWIAYQFDGVYSLGKMRVWNNNQAGGGTGRGLRWVSVDYSTDGGTWTKLGDFEFDRAPGTINYEGVDEVDFGGISAMFVVITAHHEDSDSDGIPDGQWDLAWLYGYGLSEVRFGKYGTTSNAGYTVIDESLFVNDGSVIGTYNQVADGKYGNAIHFADPNDSVMLTDATNLPLAGPVPWSINAWVRVAQTQPSGIVAGFGGYQAQSASRYIITDAEGDVAFDNPATETSNAGLVPDKWHMITAVYDTINLNLYRNGILFASEPASFGTAWSNVAVAPLAFVGDIDEFAVYNGILSKAEMAAMCQVGDVDGDDAVDQSDLLAIASQWLVVAMPVCGTVIESDLNADCIVNLEDYAHMAANWMESLP